MHGSPSSSRRGRTSASRTLTRSSESPPWPVGPARRADRPGWRSPAVWPDPGRSRAGADPGHAELVPPPAGDQAGRGETGPEGGVQDGGGEQARRPPRLVPVVHEVALGPGREPGRRQLAPDLVGTQPPDLVAG